MSIIDSPIVIRSFNEKYKNRNRQRIYVTPSAELTIEERTLVDLVFNNSLTQGNVLPKDVEDKLRRIEGNAYQVSYNKSIEMYKVRIIIDSSSNSIKIFVDTDGVYDVREYKTITLASEPAYIDTPLTKEEYILSAARLFESDVIQYSDVLAESYKVLFKVLFFVDLAALTESMEDVRAYIKTLLKNSEVTLHLSANNSVMVHGNIDADGVVTLHVREISTPDTYYTRTFALGSMYV